MANLDLVIFDCDGVLVDSEAVANVVLSEVLAGHGLALTPVEARAAFVGLSVDDVRVTARTRFGVSLPEDWSADYYAKLIPTLGERVTAVEGVADVLAHLAASGIPFCVASQGPIAKMQATLSRVGFWSLFRDHVYSAKHVPRPKPAPDLFLHAAASERVQAARCVVVGDSAVDVQAAVAAGMRVFAYCPAEEAHLMANLGATPFSTMDELSPLLGVAAEGANGAVVRRLSEMIA